MTETRLIRTCEAALLTAMSVVLIYFIHFPLIPAAPFLEYDMADVPILLSSLWLGPWWGLGILAVVSVIQAFLLGGNGWVGAVMHLVSSGVLVLIVGLICRKSRSIVRMIVAMCLGTLAMTALMIPLNLTLTVYFLGSPRGAVEALILPAIVPFNLIKASVNCVLTGLIYHALLPFLRKSGSKLGIHI